jgi:predicted nucleotidyltransferase
LLDCFVSLVQEALGDRVVSLILYGSVARGEARPESDVDVLLVLKDAPPVYRDRLRPLLPILRRLRQESCWKNLEAQGLSPSLSVLVLSREEADQNRCLYLDMLEDARILIDRENVFQNRLRALGIRLRELGARRVQRNGDRYWDLKPDLAPGEFVTL